MMNEEVGRVPHVFPIVEKLQELADKSTDFSKVTLTANTHVISFKILSISRKV